MQRWRRRSKTKQREKHRMNKQVSIGILGAGAWGMALARLLYRNGHDVTVWSKFPKEIEQLSTTRKHHALPGMVIPDEIRFTTELEKVTVNKEILLFAVPSVAIRETARAARAFIPDGQVIVDVAKGIEADTLMTMTEVIRDEIGRDGQHENIKLVALSGPTHAEEVALDMTSSIVSACTDLQVAELVQDVFMNTCMRTYTNTDILGVELCGAMKNVHALAVGISTGLGNGDNARAALITRGIAEIIRLGLKMGCAEYTFGGLAGIGDLIVTATSMHSRNNRCGILIGQGVPPMEAVRQVGTVEGINALPAAMQLMERYQVDMPIAKAVNAIVQGKISAQEMAVILMTRDKTSEVRESELALRFENAMMRHISGGIMHRVMVIGEFENLSYETVDFLIRAKEMGGHLTVALTPGKQDSKMRRYALLALRCVDRVLELEKERLTLPELMRLYRIEILALTKDQEQPETPHTVQIKRI